MPKPKKPTPYVWECGLEIDPIKEIKEALPSLLAVQKAVQDIESLQSFVNEHVAAALAAYVLDDSTVFLRTGQHQGKAFVAFDLAVGLQSDLEGVKTSICLAREFSDFFYFEAEDPQEVIDLADYLEKLAGVLREATAAWGQVDKSWVDGRLAKAGIAFAPPGLDEGD